jgi:peptidoglycan/xylan/chitin deacetylase (PgdA/CDA1 family)
MITTVFRMMCVAGCTGLGISGLGMSSFALTSFTVAAEEPLPQQQSWPGGAKAAVSLSYDDALASQLDHAVSALAAHHLKATFYLTLNADAYKTRQSEWQALAKAGHELGNHSVHHACRASLANREWVSPEQDLDHLTVAKISAEIRATNQQLLKLDQQTSRTFTPPCGDTQAKDGDYLASVAPLFSGIKVLGPAVTSMEQLAGKQLPTWFPVEPTLQQLIDYIEEAAKNGTIASITFHGVGGDHMQVDAKVHQQFLAYLAKHRDRFWVDTYHNISLHLEQI